MEEIPRLPDEHLAHAKEIVVGKRNGKSCKQCYERGYVGVNQHNMLVPCSKCVDGDAVMVEWREYVRTTPELSDLYGDYFDEEEEAEEEEEGA